MQKISLAHKGRRSWMRSGGASIRQGRRRRRPGARSSRTAAVRSRFPLWGSKPRWKRRRSGILILLSGERSSRFWSPSSRNFPCTWAERPPLMSPNTALTRATAFKSSATCFTLRLPKCFLSGMPYSPEAMTTRPSRPGRPRSPSEILTRPSGSSKPSRPVQSEAP